MDKQHILAEIKRTARENGGKPLGRERFATETGISQNDWLGKHWARWGDAVREAGFAANTLQDPMDKRELVEKFVGLMRELGHFPVEAELRIHARNNPGFPWHNTFGRLGVHLRAERKAGLAAAKRERFRVEHGKLSCEQCGMDPVEIYGPEYGESCIEVHHARVTVANMRAGHLTKLADLQCLCANCHRIEHQRMRAAAAPSHD